jgi:hypothetical protein
MKWGDVLIVGDSFCSARSESWHWPQIFTSELTGEEFKNSNTIQGKGFNGASWWSSRKLIIKELKRSTPKVAVFFHTEPLRLPHDQDWGINYRGVELKIVHQTDVADIPMSKDFAQAGRLYYEQLISLEFHEWAVHQWFLELDSLISPIEKVIHVYCFDGKYTSYTFQQGVTLAYPMIHYQQKTPMFKKNNQPEANHFTPQINKKFALALAEIIKNYPGNGTRIESAIL